MHVMTCKCQKVYTDKISDCEMDYGLVLGKISALNWCTITFERKVGWISVLGWSVEGGVAEFELCVVSRLLNVISLYWK